MTFADVENAKVLHVMVYLYTRWQQNDNSTSTEEKFMCERPFISQRALEDNVACDAKQ